MTCIASALLREAREVAEDGEADLLALLRMELAGEQMVGRDAGDERAGIGRRGRGQRLILGHDVIGVDEIDVVAPGDAGEKRRIFFLFHAVPAHVRHLEAVVRAKRHHPAGKNIQSLLRPELLALAEQELEAEADAEKRLFALHDFADRPDEVVAPEVFHAGVEGADARQHDPVGVENRRDVARDLRPAAHALEALLDAAKVPHAVIDDRDHRLPLVDRTPLTRGSMRVAWPSARASALKQASMMWCGFSPCVTLLWRFIPSWFASA